ncbi:tyrosine-protein phosphatase [bacterium]|nr:tyrosine-protein phosphatase [bacterium]
MRIRLGSFDNKALVAKAVCGLVFVLALWLPAISLAAGGTAEAVKSAPATVREKRQPRRTASQRRVTFESTRNTRDLGGLPTRKGYVKDGMLYRSGALCYATDNDRRTIAELGINTIIDLRTAKEVDKKEGPDRLPEDSSIVTMYLPMAFKGDHSIGRYYSYALDNDESVCAFFRTLAQPKAYPILYHCSAGKDRTGVMTALLLELLGTPRPVIMDDYLQSKRNSPRLKVHRHWLREIFQLIDDAGGVVVFLHNQGVSSADMRAIPSILNE